MRCFRPDPSGFLIANNTCRILLTHMTRETRKSFEIFCARADGINPVFSIFLSSSMPYLGNDSGRLRKKSLSLFHDDGWIIA